MCTVPMTTVPRIRQTPRRRGLRHLLEHLPGRALALLGKWRRRSRGRSELAVLSDASLRDIGLTRYDADREAGKPFWRA